MNKFIHTNIAVWVAFLMALLSKFVLLFNYRVIEGDKAMQVAGAVSLLKEKGYNLYFVNANNFEDVQKIRIGEWPPLYSYLLMPLLKITRMDLDVSCYVIDMISITLFVSFFWMLIKQIGFPNIVQFFTLIFVAFFVRRYFTSSPSTDILSVAFLMGSFHFFLSYIKSDRKKDLLLLTIFMVAVAYTRYMYLPVILLFPFLLIWHGYRQKKRKYLIEGSILLLVCIIVFTPLLINSYWIAGSLNNKWTKGFFLEKTFSLSPVFWDTLIDKEFFMYQISTQLGIGYVYVFSFLIYSNYLILLILLVFSLKKLMTKSLFKKASDTLYNFFIYGGLLCVAIIFVLAYCSVISKLDVEKFGIIDNWTYLGESRYFIFVHLYLLIGLIYLAFVSSKRYTKTWQTIRVMLFVLFVVEISHGAWVLLNSSLKNRSDFTAVSRIAARKKLVDNLVAEGRQQNYEPVFFLHYSANFIAYASLNETKFCVNFENFSEDSVRVNQPTRIIFITPQAAARTYYHSFLEKHKFSFVQNLDSTCVYSKYLLPRGF